MNFNKILSYLSRCIMEMVSMNMRKKGFTFSLSIMSFIIIIFVAIIITLSMVFMTTFHIYITKKFIIERVLESTQAQDALLALLEMEQEGIKFRKAIVYSLYENSSNPKIWNGEKIVEYNLEDTAKIFLNYFYENDDYWLFIYNEKDDEIKTICKSKVDVENLFKKESRGNRRASFPIDEKRWLILYVKLSTKE